jgi:hypothetical protein
MNVANGTIVLYALYMPTHKRNLIVAGGNQM